MRANGHHSYHPPDHTSILIHIAGQIGHIEARQSGLLEDIREIKVDVATLKQAKPARPLSEYLPAAVGLVILAAASAGKVGWSEALPSLLGLVGR